MTASILSKETLYSGWNRLVMVRARTTRGSEISRAVEDHGEAVAVLPFDPQRRVAMMVRQLRVPLLMAHEVQSSLETPAGILDAEDPADCARREAMEEAGLSLSAVLPAGTVYPMAGVSTERIHLFLAEYGVADRVGDGGGLVEETEEIEVAEIALAELAAMADAGTLHDLKTLALIQTLRLRRPELFAR